MKQNIDLLILNGPSSLTHVMNTAYRGTDRSHPTYCDDLPETHKVNSLFLWFLEEGGELGVVHDLQMAQTYTNLLNRHVVDRRFELIEVSQEQQMPRVGGEFLGFDLSLRYNTSLLTSGFRVSNDPEGSFSPVDELADLVCRHYAPQLNHHGLFQDYDTGSSCLRAMSALQHISGGLYEGEDLSGFKVTSIWSIAGEVA